MRVPAKLSEIIEIYLDESSQTKHRFLVIGALAVDAEQTAKINALIKKARLPQLPNGEAKWVKVSKSKLTAYKRLVDIVFDNPDDIHFHSLFVDTSQVDHKAFNEGDKEIGFNKEVYQLANKIGQLYSTRYFHVYPDYRDCKSAPEDLRLILNRGCQKHGDKRDWPFRRCQFRDSKEVLLLQVTDVLIGALAFHLNGHAKALEASAAKLELANYILKRAGIAEVTKGTHREGKFTVWPRKLRKVVP